jgi:hypothetical protein
VAVFLDSVYLVRVLFLRPHRWASALLGMALFWAAEAFAAWAALAALGLRVSAAALIVGFGTGMVFTRRTGPLGGAGVLILVLPPAPWYSGVPLAAAVAGVFIYQVLFLWLPMPVALTFPPASSPPDSGPDMWLHRSASTQTVPLARMATTGTSPSIWRTGLPSGRPAVAIRYCQPGLTRCGTCSAWLAPPASRKGEMTPSSPLTETAASPAKRSARLSPGRAVPGHQAVKA